MYHLRSRHTAVCLKLAAWLLLINWLLLPAAFIVLILAWVRIDRQLALLSVCLIAAAGVVGVIQWGLSALVRCPLCLTTPIARRACSKHRKAKRLLGSYRLRVACAVIFRKYFRCPYCGKTTTVNTRVDSP